MSRLLGCRSLFCGGDSFFFFKRGSGQNIEKKEKMNFFTSETLNVPTQEIKARFLDNAAVQLHIRREDLIHADVSGNKFRKLKYNILQAQKNGYKQLLTFGGAYSNHIAATAAAGKLCGLQTIGVIRGEELGDMLEKTLESNDTLRFAKQQGMQLHFVTRTQYREKTTAGFLEELIRYFGDFYLIPEGGTNELAILGCQEILTKEDGIYDYICCAVGTGGTISGIINATGDQQHVLGFPALKGNFLRKEIECYTAKTNWSLMDSYHFGGYGKVNQELVTFMNSFKKDNTILLDPLYTGKMLYGLYDLIKTEYFPKKSRILAVHTGGLQGISGINKQLKKKQLPVIEVGSS